MSRTEASVARRIASGAVAGLLAGLVASLVMDRFQALAQPPSNDEDEPATQQAADKVAIAATGTPLTAQARPAAGQLVHYGLGAALGIGYGVAAEFAPQVTAGAGTAFATGVWALLDQAAVPAAGLGDPPWRAPATTQAYGLVSHVVFGLAAEATRRAARGLMPD